MPAQTADQILQFTQSVMNRRTGQGNPQSNGQYGELGWTYQDWQSGQLYVYGETTGPNGWMPVLRNENPSVLGGDGAIFTVDGGYAQWGYQIHNSNGLVMYWSQFNGLTVDSILIGGVSAQFDSRNLCEGSGEVTVSWGACQLFDPINQQLSITWADRRAYDNYSSTSIDWGSRTLTTLNNDAGEQNQLSWTSSRGVELTGSPYNSPVESFVPKISGLGATGAPITAFNTQSFSPTTGSTINPAFSSGNDILIALEHPATIATLTIGLANMLNNLPGGVGSGGFAFGETGTEARVQIYSRHAVTALTVTYPGYTFVGAPITTIAANGTHVLRVSGNKIYHVQ